MMRLAARLTPLLALFAVCASPATARAALIVSGGTVTTVPGGSGFVQVELTNTSATPRTLSGFSVDIALGGTGVRFTGVDSQTASAFVFDGFGSGTLTFDAFPNQGFNLSDVVADFTLNPAGFVALAPGQTVGLGHIAFAVDAGANGGARPITFLSGPGTLFIDAAGDVYQASDISLGNGGIDVRGSVTAVPEPASALVFLVGSGFGLLVARRRRL